MTPAMLDALLDRHLEAHRGRMMAAGTVAAAVYNAAPFRERGARLVEPMDFVPKRPTEEKTDEQSLDEQISILTAVMGCGPTK